MHQFLTVDQAKEFANLWLPAWTDNQPERLIEFYAKDTFYLDPAVPKGIIGKTNLFDYFQKLLSKNPNWVWSQIEALPMQGGFLNKWHASIPHHETIVECTGVCLVIFDEEKKIKRNEVYFDRTPLITP